MATPTQSGLRRARFYLMMERERERERAKQKVSRLLFVQVSLLSAALRPNKAIAEANLYTGAFLANLSTQSASLTLQSKGEATIEKRERERQEPKSKDLCRESFILRIFLHILRETEREKNFSKASSTGVDIDRK